MYVRVVQTDCLQCGFGTGGLQLRHAVDPSGLFVEGVERIRTGPIGRRRDHQIRNYSVRPSLKRHRDTNLHPVLPVVNSSCLTMLIGYLRENTHLEFIHILSALWAYRPYL